MPVRELHSEHRDNSEVDVLTEGEIKQLFAAIELLLYDACKPNTSFHEALQQRDKAMLAVFYGCGLRRNEGFQMDITDINFVKGLLHVRKGKNYTERVIPVSNKNIGYLRSYIHEGRQALLNEKKQDALFVTARGTRMQGQSMLIRLKLLITLTDNTTLQQKSISLHTLRHSIATHLLAAGMTLERIKDFLGHTSLESTQVYTHLTPYENNAAKYPYPIRFIPDRQGVFQ